MRVFVASLLVLIAARTAAAEVYSWVDDDGVIHFANVPDNPGAQPSPQANTTNTFDWRDDAGKLRRLHRVHVNDYDAFIVEAARYYTLPPALVKATIAAESAFEPTVVSPAGAMGLMQLMPDTASAMRVKDPYDPRANIYGGTRYLRLMANRFDGDLRLTIAAYNAGPDAVERAGTIPPFSETRTYVKRVLQLYTHYLHTWNLEEQRLASDE